MKVQSESVLEPSIRTLVRELLCKSFSSRLLYRIADSHVLEDDEEDRYAHSIYSIDDKDMSSNRNSGSKSTTEPRGGQGKRRVEFRPPSTGEETWLVPVRTARDVLAVLKIEVKSSAERILNDNLSPSRSFSRVSFPSPDQMSPGFINENLVRDGDDHFCTEETEGRDRTAPARDAVIAFSNILAPLLSTAIQREMELSCEVCQQ